jgi:hypothetical protein
MKRCAFYGGRLGLVSHRKGSLRFCKRVHNRHIFNASVSNKRLKAEEGCGSIF